MLGMDTRLNALTCLRTSDGARSSEIARADLDACSAADNVTDGDGLGISARRLNNNLTPSLGAFRVNVSGYADEENPQVALLFLDFETPKRIRVNGAAEIRVAHEQRCGDCQHHHEPHGGRNAEGRANNSIFLREAEEETGLDLTQHSETGYALERI
mgnify:CR=1 FL=1